MAVGPYSYDDLFEASERATNPPPPGTVDPYYQPEQEDGYSELFRRSAMAQYVPPEPGWSGRPGVRGSHYSDRDPEPLYEKEDRPPFDRKESVNYLQPYLTKSSVSMSGLDDQTLEAAHRWVMEIEKMGYKPVVSSAYRTQNTAGTGHKAGAAIDVGLYTKDGRLLNNDKLEYDITRKAAAKAGFKYALNELDSGVNTKYKSGAHIHLSMHAEGEPTGDHNHEHADAIHPELAKKMPRTKQGLREYAHQMARVNGIDPKVFEAMLETESGFRGYDDDGNIITSSAGAIGMAQFTPDTLKDLEREFGITEQNYKESEVHQIRAGALWLGKLLKQNGGDLAGALAAYNAGQGGVERIRALGGARGGYDETRHYVKKILNLAGHKVSLDEAESMIINGGIKNRLPDREKLWEDDRQTLANFTKSYFENITTHGVEDAFEGGRHFVSGLTFGASELFPGLATQDSWKNLKDYGSFKKGATSLALEIPHFLGILMAGEVIGTAMGGKSLLTNMAEGGSRLHFGGLFGKEALSLPTWMQTNRVSSAVSGSLGSVYGKYLAGAEGGASALGRFVLGNSPVTMTTTASLAAAEGMHDMVTNFTKRWKDDQPLKAMLPELMTDFFGGAARGLAIGLALPMGMTAAAVVGAGTVGNAARAGSAALELSPAGRAVIGGVLGGIAGAATAGPEYGAGTGMALGALAGGLGHKTISPARRAMIRQGMTEFVNKMDDATKNLWTAAITDASVAHLKMQNEASKEISRGNFVKAFDERAAALDDQVQVWQTQRQKLQQQMGELEEQIARKQSILQGYEEQGVKNMAESLTQAKQSHKSLLKAHSEAQAHSNQVLEQLNKNRASPKRSELAREYKESLGNVGLLSKQIRENQARIKELSEDSILVEHSRLMDSMGQLQQQKRALESSPEWTQAMELTPKLEEGAGVISSWMKRVTQHVNDGEDLAHLPKVDFDFDPGHSVPEVRKAVMDSINDSISAMGRQMDSGDLVGIEADREARRLVSTFLNPTKTNETMWDVMDLYRKDVESKLQAMETMKPGSGTIYKLTSRNSNTGKSYADKMGVKWDYNSEDSVYMMDATKVLNYFEDVLGAPKGFSDEAHEIANVWRTSQKGVKAPSMSLMKDGTPSMSRDDFYRLKAAVQAGETHLPVKMGDAEVKEFRSAMREYYQGLHEIQKDQLNKELGKLTNAERLLQSRNLVDIGEAGNPEIGGLFGGDPSDLSQSAMERRAAKILATEEELPIDDAIQRIRHMSLEEKTDLFKGQIDELNMMFREQDSPSGLKALALEKSNLLEKISEEGEGYYSKMVQEIADPFGRYDQSMHEALLVGLKEAHATVDPNYVMGATYDTFMDAAYGLNKAGEELSEMFGKFGSEELEALITKTGLEGDKLVTFKNRIASALEDHTEATQFLKEHPEARGFFGQLLDFQRWIEKSKVADSQLQAFFRQEYMMHRFPELTRHFADLASDSRHSTQMVKIAQEEMRTIGTIKEARDLYTKAKEKLDSLGITKEKFFRLAPDEKAQALGGLSKKQWNALADSSKEGYRIQAGKTATHLRLDTVITDPVDLMKAQIRSVYGALSNRRFLEALSMQHVAVADGKTLPLLMNFKEGSLSPYVESRFRVVSKDPEILGDTGTKLQKIGIGKERAATPYKKLSELPGWENTYMFDDMGKQIPARDLYVHPDAAGFLQEHVGSRKFSKTQRNIDQALGIVRGLKLAGTPQPHLFNIWSAQIAEFMETPFKAMGFFGAGKKIAEEGIGDLSGGAAKLNAIRAGVNHRTMRQATRLISQEIYGQNPDLMRQMMGGQDQGVGRMLQAIDPQNPELREAARQSMGPRGRNIPAALGFIPDLDLMINRKMLFSAIEDGQIAGFHYRTMTYLDQLARTEPGFMNLSKATQLRIAQKAAADQTNRLAGALPYMWASDGWRRAIYSTTLTPSWFLAKAQGFLMAVDGTVGLFGTSSVGKKLGLEAAGAARLNSRFAHLPPQARKLMAQRMIKTVASGMMGMVGFTQVASYMINGHSTFEHTPDRWFHLRVGDKYYNSPLFGYFRDIAKTLGGAAGEEAVTPFFELLAKQMAPHVKMGLDQLQGRDTRTGERLDTLYDRVSHVAQETTAYREILGLKDGSNIFDVLSMGERGAVKRLKGREWMLRELGVWESDYNAPLAIGGRLSAELGVERMRLRDQVTETLKAARDAHSPDLRERLINRAYSLARNEGIKVRNKDLAKELPGGRLTLSAEGVKNLTKRIFQPTAYAANEANFPDPVMRSVLERIQKDEELERVSMLKTYPYYKAARMALPATAGSGAMGISQETMGF